MKLHSTGFVWGSLALLERYVRHRRKRNSKRQKKGGQTVAKETLVALSMDSEAYGTHATRDLYGHYTIGLGETTTFEAHYWLFGEDRFYPFGEPRHACVVATGGPNPACAERPHMLWENHWDESGGVSGYLLYRYDGSMKLAEDVVGNTLS